MTPLERILSHLDNVRGPNGQGEFRASCPGPLHEHGNRTNPALCLNETFEGKPIINCHVGCTDVDVLAALALTWADVYRDRDDQHRRRAVRTDYKMIVDLAKHECWVVAIGLSDLLDDLQDGLTPLPEDIERLREAAARLARMMNYDD